MHLGQLIGWAALVLSPLAVKAQAGGLAPPVQLVHMQAEGEEPEAGGTTDTLSTSNVTLDEPLTEEELAWAQAAWAYFSSPGTVPRTEEAPPTGGAPQTGGAPSGDNSQPAAGSAPAASPPRASGLGLVPARSGAPIASAWSMGDQVAATVLAHRLGLIGDREFDQRFTRLLTYFNTMPLAFGELPNRFYSTETGAMLGEDFAEGQAGWSAVDTGRLLIWLRIAAAEHPEFAPFIRNAAARMNVCRVLSADQRLQAARPGENGTSYGPETLRGYDAYAVQGYRAWGLEASLPEPSPADAEIDIGGTRFEVAEDVSNQAPVMTTPPAYLGLEFGFEPIGAEAGEEVAGGYEAEELLTVIHDLQARRFTEEGMPTARADFRRSEEPFTLYGTILKNGYPWSTVELGGALRPRLDLISTRAVFGLDAFFDSEFVDSLSAITAELYDPASGWYEGRYEATGAYETTRTSATNAFILETIAYRHLGPLFPEEARPEGLEAVTPDSGPCRLPLALSSDP